MESNNKIRLYQQESIYEYIKEKFGSNYKTEIDSAENISVFANTCADKETLILFNTNEPYLVISDIDLKNKRASFEAVRLQKIASDQIVLKGQKPIGIIRNETENNKEQYIEIFTDENLGIGDAVFFEKVYLCKDELLYTNMVSENIACILCNSLFNTPKDIVKSFYFTISNSQESAMCFLNKQKFDNIILIDLIETENFVSKSSLNERPVLLMKNGGYVLRNSFFKKIEKLFKNESKYQTAFCKDNSLAERIETAYSIPVYSLAIPVEFKNTRLPKVSIDIIKGTAELAAEIVGLI